MTHIKIRLDLSAVRLWHIRLVERIAKHPGFTVETEAVPGFGGLPANADTLFDFESILHGLTRPGLATRVKPNLLPPPASDHAAPTAVVIDMSGGEASGTPGIWRLDFDGRAGETGLLASALAGRAPVATIRDGARIVATARLGTERPGIVLAAFEDFLARTITLIVAALDGAASTTLPSATEDPLSIQPFQFGRADTARKIAREIASAIVRRLYNLCCRAPHWRIGWRRIAGPDLVDLGRHPDGGWTDIADDGLRFYADPFPIDYRGAVTLFVEEFDHRTQKGIISAAPFGPQGLIGPLTPVLERPGHLSYPFVFEQDGEVWMIPESCTARTIDLYRATRFPGGWVLETTLVDNVVAGDATITQHQGRWWMFATVQDEGGAFSDSLHLWSAPDFRGPWTAHPRNPVLIDIASARPAGRMTMRGGALIRPVQDCRNGYGNALGLARVLRLDDVGFEQRVETVLHAGPAWPGRRLHTLNAAGGYEFIDGSRFARRRLI